MSEHAIKNSLENTIQTLNNDYTKFAASTLYFLKHPGDFYELTGHFTDSSHVTNAIESRKRGINYSSILSGYISEAHEVFKRFSNSFDRQIVIPLLNIIMSLCYAHIITIYIWLQNVPSNRTYADLTLQEICIDYLNVMVDQLHNAFKLPKNHEKPSDSGEIDLELRNKVANNVLAIQTESLKCLLKFINSICNNATFQFLLQQKKMKILIDAFTAISNLQANYLNEISLNHLFDNFFCMINDGLNIFLTNMCVNNIGNTEYFINNYWPAYFRSYFVTVQTPLANKYSHALLHNLLVNQIRSYNSFDLVKFDATHNCLEYILSEEEEDSSFNMRLNAKESNTIPEGDWIFTFYYCMAGLCFEPIIKSPVTDFEINYELIRSSFELLNDEWFRPLTILLCTQYGASYINTLSRNLMIGTNIETKFTILTLLSYMFIILEEIVQTYIKATPPTGNDSTNFQSSFTITALINNLWQTETLNCLLETISNVLLLSTQAINTQIRDYGFSDVKVIDFMKNYRYQYSQTIINSKVALTSRHLYKPILSFMKSLVFNFESNNLLPNHIIDLMFYTISDTLISLSEIFITENASEIKDAKNAQEIICHNVSISDSILFILKCIDLKHFPSDWNKKDFICALKKYAVFQPYELGAEQSAILALNLLNRNEFNYHSSV